ncbi:MAG: HIRAN domain-containing protein [Chloroflexota bacterium]
MLRLELRPVPEDKNAVAVLTRSGDQLGWLSREIAKELAPALRKDEKRIGCKIAEVTGGGWGPFKKTRGCNILVSKWIYS